MILKNPIFYILIRTLISCNSANNFYQGKVLDENEKPIQSVTIFEEERKNSSVATTDSTGYFRLARSPEWLGNLIFIKEGFKSDTIPSVGRQSGKRIRYYFIENDTTIVRLKSAGADMFIGLNARHFPIMDSTNFDNFENSGEPDTQGFLKRIKFDPQCKDAMNFRLHYKIPFSENFTAIVVSYQCGENELFATLITVNKENRIVDKLDIAYDEVAESAFGKTSKIEKDKITVTSSNWMEEKPIFKDETYVLEENGKFTYKAQL